MTKKKLNKRKNSFHVSIRQSRIAFRACYLCGCSSSSLPRSSDLPEGCVCLEFCGFVAEHNQPLCILWNGAECLSVGRARLKGLILGLFGASPHILCNTSISSSSGGGLVAFPSDKPCREVCVCMYVCVCLCVYLPVWHPGILVSSGSGASSFFRY